RRGVRRQDQDRQARHRRQPRDHGRLRDRVDPHAQRLRRRGAPEVDHRRSPQACADGGDRHGPGHDRLTRDRASRHSRPRRGGRTAGGRATDAVVRPPASSRDPPTPRATLGIVTGPTTPPQQPAPGGTRLDPWFGAYAERAHGMRASEIRALFAVANRPEVVSLAGGMPYLEGLPLDQIADTMQRLVATRGATALQYGSGQGDETLRERILD